MTASLAGVMREGLLLALLLAAPFVIGALVAGAITGLIGVVTQVQEPSIGLVPRVAAIGLALVLFGPSIGTQLQAFFAKLWPMIGAIGPGS